MKKASIDITLLDAAIVNSIPGNPERVVKDSQFRRLSLRSIAEQQELHTQWVDQLNKELPFPSDKTRGFVFRR